MDSSEIKLIGPKLTQFSDLPSSLVIDILLRLPIKDLLMCKYVRKDWTRLYFSDQDLIRRHLETSNIQYLNRRLEEGIKFRLECFVDEVSIGNLRIETLDFSCKSLHDPKYNWCVVNSCNGLVCLIDGEDGPYGTPQPYSYYNPNSRIYVCNPILGESVSVPYPNRDGFYASQCALGFSAKNNQYKILLCIRNSKGDKFRWEIYTVGTRRGWRSIETEKNLKPWKYSGLDFNTFIHGSLHWTYYSYTKGAYAEGTYVLQSFDFETERFTVLPLPEIRRYYELDVTLGVINGCLWASFYNRMQNDNGEMWAMKDYGVDKPWTMMLALRSGFSNRYGITDEELCARNKELVLYKKEDICFHKLLFTLNGGNEMLTWHWISSFVSYNIEKPRCRVVDGRSCGFDCGVAYIPSFVSLGDVVAEEEQVIS